MQAECNEGLAGQLAAHIQAMVKMSERRIDYVNRLFCFCSTESNDKKKKKSLWVRPQPPHTHTHTRVAAKMNQSYALTTGRSMPIDIGGEPLHLSPCGSSRLRLSCCFVAFQSFSFISRVRLAIKPFKVFEKWTFCASRRSEGPTGIAPAS